MKIIAINRKARHNYTIEDTIEAGIVLLGSEVKSLRNNQANIQEAYVYCTGQSAYLVGANIATYQNSDKMDSHEPRKKRKLLLHKRQINKITALVEKKGYTLLPLKLYFNDNGYAKLQIATAKGKKLHDKRQTQKEKEWSINKNRILKNILRNK